MVDKLGLNFGSSATSARTSKDLLQHTPVDFGGATAVTGTDTAVTADTTTRAHTNRAVPCDVTSARDLSEQTHRDGQHDAVPTARFSGAGVSGGVHGG